MNALIKIDPRKIGTETINAVNARELHAFLEVGKDFTTWVKVQIDRARLVEHRDFEKLTQKGELSTTGQTRTEYALTVESAKHIAMMSGTEKGFEVRDYFIECEKKVQTLAMNPANMSRLQILTMAIEAEQKVQELACKLEMTTPKAAALDRIATFSEGAFCIRDSAKMLQMREKDLLLYLSSHNWTYRTPNKSELRGYSEPLQKGLLEHKFTEGDKTDGTGKWSSTQVRITAKGLAKLALIFGVAIAA